MIIMCKLQLQYFDVSLNCVKCIYNDIVKVFCNKKVVCSLSWCWHCHYTWCCSSTCGWGNCTGCCWCSLRTWSKYHLFCISLLSMYTKFNV